MLVQVFRLACNSASCRSCLGCNGRLFEVCEYWEGLLQEVEWVVKSFTSSWQLQKLFIVHIIFMFFAKELWIIWSDEEVFLKLAAFLFLTIFNKDKSAWCKFLEGVAEGVVTRVTLLTAFKSCFLSILDALGSSAVLYCRVRLYCGTSRACPV